MYRPVASRIMSDFKLNGSPVQVQLGFVRCHNALLNVLNLLGSDPALAEVRARLVDVSIDLSSICGQFSDVYISKCWDERHA